MTITQEISATEEALAASKPRTGIKVRSHVRAGRARSGDEPFNPQPDPPG